ncbi:hypothetical protein DVJ77_19370 [Dyella tabacisoli]|uniref:Uncharacterized protein n=2 Tax=Dyella tabacisoli TaxID=2282381 RepID=A0A369UH08_9GAMM|nr:hypothetical protein DVJ77_19370 [Dyella tabacisoli]
MPVSKGEHFAQRDIYIDYSFEEVMFRCDHVTGSIFRRFYGEGESAKPVPHDNHLFNHALLYGDEITSEQYEQGKERS